MQMIRVNNIIYIYIQPAELEKTFTTFAVKIMIEVVSLFQLVAGNIVKSCGN